MKYLFCFLLSIPLLLQAQTNRYVSSSYDGSAGTSIGTMTRPYTSISQLPTTLVAGDSVFLKRGDVFPISSTWTLDDDGTALSNIYVGAYPDSGAKPLITGLVRLQNWTNYSGNIWYKTLLSEPEYVFVSGKMTAKGRYPKNKYLIYDFNWTDPTKVWYNPNKDVFHDTALINQPSWTGADIVLRDGGQTAVFATVTAHAGDSMRLSTTASGANHLAGYFFRNHMRTLTANGDWMYDAAANRLYMYQADTSQRVEISSPIQAVWFRGNYNKIRNVAIEGVTTAFYVKTNQFTYIDSCEVRLSGTGVSADGGSMTDQPPLGNYDVASEGAVDVWATNNYFHDLGDNGARSVISCPRQHYKFNTFENIGVVPFAGRNSNSSSSGDAGNFSSDSIVFQNNRLINIGFHGTYARRDKLHFDNNYINGFALVKDDAGGIYIWTSDNDTMRHDGTRIVSGNIITGGSSAGGENNNTSVRAHALYSDLSFNNVYKNNVCFNNSGDGIVLVASDKETIRDNIFVNNKANGIDLSSYSSARGGGVYAGTKMYNNLSVNNSKYALKMVKPKSLSTLIYKNALYTGDSNYYRSPTPLTIDTADAAAFALTKWQTYTSKEAHSVWEVHAGEEVRVEYNETAQPKTINLNPKTFRNLKTNATITGPLTLKPNESVALLYLFTNTIPTTPDSLRLVAVGTTTAVLNVVAVAGNNLYNVYMSSTGAAGAYGLVLPEQAAGNVVVTGLAANTTYYFKVSASNTAGSSGQSIASRAVTTLASVKFQTRNPYTTK